MITPKRRKFLFSVFTLACLVAAGVCLIVNMAINRQVTWAAYPLLSIAFGWAVLSPLFVKKHGIVLFLCAVTLLILPYLYLISKITPVTDWFIPIGLPAAIVGVVALWISYLLHRYAKINIWLKSAIFVLLLGAVDFCIDYFVDIYLNTAPFGWDKYLSASIYIVVSGIMGILGYMKSKPK